VCQYAETDLNLVCRLLEYMGVYFYFEDSAGTCKMVMADDLSYPANPFAPSIPFTDPSGPNNYDSIVQIAKHVSQTAVLVTVSGYNYESVGTAVTGSYGMEVDGQTLSGDYPAEWTYDPRTPDPDNAGRLAQLRAQEACSAACTTPAAAPSAACGRGIPSRWCSTRWRPSTRAIW
ncbi:MAG TPA: phage late control D family protein, partial [Gammaproteobacteria bacterium]